MQKLIAFLDDLVWPADEVEVILFEERVQDALAVGNADSSFEVEFPALVLGVGIGPQKITDDFVIFDLHRPLDAVYCGQLVDQRT